MKLKLTNEEGVALLDIIDDVDPRGLEVLRAGMTKLLETGRNRIILNFRDARSLNVESMKELIKFHEMARELDGQLMLVGQGALIRQAAKVAGPDGSSIVPRCYSTKKAALAAMRDVAPPAADDVDYALGDDPNGLLRKRVAQLTAELASLSVKARELKQVETLRTLQRENGALKRQLASVSEMLARLKAEKKPPFIFEDLDRKVDLASRSLAWLLGEAGLTPPAERPREIPPEKDGRG